MRIVDTEVLAGLTRTEFISGMLREFSMCNQFCGRGVGVGECVGRGESVTASQEIELHDNR